MYKVGESCHNSPGYNIKFFPREHFWRRSRGKNAWNHSWCSQTQKPGYVGQSQEVVRSILPWWNLIPLTTMSSYMVCIQEAYLTSGVQFFSNPKEGRKILRWIEETTLVLTLEYLHKFFKYKILLILESEEGKGQKDTKIDEIRKKHWLVVFCMPPTGVQAYNHGTYPDWELNQ